MFNNKNIDEEITRLVKSEEAQIPSLLENKLRTEIEKQKPKYRMWSKRLVLPFGIVSTAVVILTLVLLFPLLPKSSEPLINEIYTEFEIKDKNIKIIFVQSRDFNQFMEGENE